MKYLILILSLLKAEDYFFKNPGVVLEETPLAEVISTYEIKINYLLIFEHPVKETENIRELTKCAISNTNTAGVIKRYKESIDEKWKNILQSSDFNVTNYNSRGKRSMIGGLAIGLGSVLAMYSMSHYHQSVSQHTEDIIHANSEKLDRHIKLFKSVMLKSNEHRLKVDALICNLYYGQNYNSIGLHLSERAQLIERIIVKSSSNKIPKNAKILNDLFNICIDAQFLRSSIDSAQFKNLVRKLCRTWAVNKSDAIFKGAIRDSIDNIQVKMEISVPILDLLSPIQKKFKITNLGFYSETEKLLFVLPREVYKFKGSNKFYMSSDDDLLLRRQNFQVSTCISEMFINGTTSSCQSSPIPSNCIVKPFKDSFLTSFNGTYREHRATKLITYTGSLILNSGEIFCSDGSYIEMVHRNSKLNYTDFYEWHATLTNLSEFSNWNQTVEKTKINDLGDESKFYKFHNYLVYLSLGLNFLLIVAFAILAIKIFGFTDKPNVITARPKPEVLEFPRANLKPRPKSEYLGSQLK